MDKRAFCAGAVVGAVVAVVAVAAGALWTCRAMLANSWTWLDLSRKRSVSNRTVRPVRTTAHASTQTNVAE